MNKENTTTIRDAIRDALKEALEDPRVFLIGEDIGPYGGAYAVTKGFHKEFGPERIKDSPLSESVFTGAAAGAAMVGLRPIVEIMTINFSLLALDQIVNHATKVRFMSGGQINCPMIIRTVTGGGGQLAATHSQSLEGWFATLPGMKVVAPSTPQDALDLFRACRDEEDPVLFLEHSLLYGKRGAFNLNNPKSALGKAAIRRSGKDVTIIAWLKMVDVALEAAVELDKHGIQAEVIDIRTLKPLDSTTILNSVEKTHKALVLDEAWSFGGFANEIVHQIQADAFDYLDFPVMKIAGKNVPLAYSKVLEDLSIPTSKEIVEKILANF